MEWNIVPEGPMKGQGQLPGSGRLGATSDSNGASYSQPYLEILVQPQGKFRFRYKSEMTGKHGSLSGSNLNNLALNSNCTPSMSIQNDFKTYPTVKIHNFSGSAIIRSSLVCSAPPHYPHAHLLTKSGSGSSSPVPPEIQVQQPTSPNFVDGVVSASNNYTFVLSGVNIIYTGKKSARRELVNKMAELEEFDERKLRSEQDISDLALHMNLNMVSLYFEAFTNMENGHLERICSPVISQPIQHNSKPRGSTQSAFRSWESFTLKPNVTFINDSCLIDDESTKTSELRIVRIDKYASFCTGDEEVFVLVEKVDKHNIQIKFFQENERGIEIWKAYGRFSKLDVHHQYAIVFKTPPYRSADIDTDVDVWVQLERPSDGATSPQIRFKYKPVERLRKMPRHQAPRNEGEGRGRSRDRQSPNYYENPNNVPEGGMPQGVGNIAQGPLAGPSASSVRQGSAGAKFPCDLSQLNAEKKPKELALNVALSVGECLHSWAETSDFNVVLQKLRHLLCLVNENGDNALHTAILNGQYEPFVQILNTVSTSPDVSSIINDTNLSGLTPLALAVLLNVELFVRQLLIYHADISIPNFDGDTPIHLAIKSQHINCLSLLLCSPKAYQVINKFNYNSLTPLHLAVNEGSFEGIDVLCRAQCIVSCQEGSYGRTPLHIAIEKKSFPLAMMLLKAAGDRELVNIQNYRGDTPLHCAVSTESPSSATCALLLHFGADPTIENFIRKESDELEELQRGQTVFDLVTTPEIQEILNSGSVEWEKFLRNFLNTSLEIQNTPIDLQCLENLNIDSGIDIKDST